MKEEFTDLFGKLDAKQQKKVLAFATSLLKGADVSLRFQKLSYDEIKKFGMNQQNRLLDSTHLKSLKTEFANSLDYIPPISVNARTKNIIDGQHRAQAFIELCDEGVLDKGKDKLMVHFVSMPKEEEKDRIILMNTKVKKWQSSDYIHSYAPINNDYSKLTEWCLNHRLCHKEATPYYRYAAAIITGKNCNSILKKGKFEVTDEQWQEAENNHKEIYDIIESASLTPSGSYIEGLAIAWITNKKWVLKVFGSFDRFLTFVKSDKEHIWEARHNCLKDWMNLFGDFYGHIINKHVHYDKSLNDRDFPYMILTMNENGGCDSELIDNIEDLKVATDDDINF